MSKNPSVQAELAKKRQGLLRRSPAQKASLMASKRIAMKAAVSAQMVAEDPRVAFGFFPSGVEAKVLSWPKL